MGNCFGIRREDKNRWERRVPLTPRHVEQMIKDGLQAVVQPSANRAFSDEEYRQVGAAVQEDLSVCPVTLAVKEIPTQLFRPGHTYLFFAHVLKGQPHNMPMLRRLLDLGCTLIDYEKITDEAGKRLVFFGRYAGIAGMVDSLWALGERLKLEGFQTPFAAIRPAHAYRNLEEIQGAMRGVGVALKQQGLPSSLSPMVFGFSGYGNVSLGAQEVFDLLPHRTLSPQELVVGGYRGESGQLIKVVFREEHLAKPRDAGKAFDLADYFKFPEHYEGDFERFIPHLTVLVNCIYWTPAYPRLVTCKLLKEIYGEARPPRLRVIADISCDINGSVECTTQCTDSSAPLFVYVPESEQSLLGLEGNGPVVLAVDNLPCELPVESSLGFGDALLPFAREVVRADYKKPYEKLELPPPILRAVIAHQGALTPSFAHLEQSLLLYAGEES